MLVFINGELFIVEDQELENGKLFTVEYQDQEMQEKLGLDSPEEQYEDNEAFINHYVDLLMENAGCHKCTRDVLINFMEEIIYKMN